jgi:hypothetical protein
VEIMRDDYSLVEHPLLNVRRANLMRDWYALNRDDSDRWVNLPLYRLIVTTDVDWPKEEMDEA